MAGRDGEHDLVPDERLELERAVPPKRADDAELELALRDLLDDGLRVPDGESDVELGMRALKLAEEERDEVRAGAGGGADRERALQLSALVGDLVVELLLEGEHAAGRCDRAGGPPRSARRAVPSGRGAVWPSRSSSARTWRLTAGCVTPSFSAACEKLLFSTTAQKAAS